MVWYLEMNLGTTTYKYKLEGIKSFVPKQRKPVSSISLPGAPASSNILLALMGMEKTYDISFFITDKNEDMSMGTAPSSAFPSGVKTRAEQQKWLFDYIHKPELGATWKLYTDSINGEVCILEEITIEQSSENPLHDECTIRLTVGTVIA